MPPKTLDAFEGLSIMGIGTRSESIRITRARGRTTLFSSATDRSSDRRRSGMRNPPSAGTFELYAFWSRRASPSFFPSSSRLARDYRWCQMVRRKSAASRSEEHTSELQSRENLVCRLLLEKKKNRE